MLGCKGLKDQFKNMHTGVRVQRDKEKSVACAKKLRIHDILTEFI